jgi:hypothetical protein
LTRDRPDTERDDRCYYVMREGRTKTKRLAAYAGSRLKPTIASGRTGACAEAPIRLRARNGPTALTML